MDPRNSTGECSTTTMRLRRSPSLKSPSGRPSRRMRPASGSTNRRNRSASVDLPAPEAPRSTTLLPAGTSMLIGFQERPSGLGQYAHRLETQRTRAHRRAAETAAGRFAHAGQLKELVDPGEAHARPMIARVQRGDGRGRAGTAPQIGDEGDQRAQARCCRGARTSRRVTNVAAVARCPQQTGERAGGIGHQLLAQRLRRGRHRRAPPAGRTSHARRPPPAPSARPTGSRPESRSRGSPIRAPRACSTRCAAAQRAAPASCSGSRAATSSARRHERSSITAPTTASVSTLLTSAAAASVPKRCTSAMSPSSRLTQVAHRQPRKAPRRDGEQVRVDGAAQREQRPAGGAHVDRAMHAAEHEPGHGERQHADAGAREHRRNCRPMRPWSITMRVSSGCAADRARDQQAEQERQARAPPAAASDAATAARRERRQPRLFLAE